MPQKETLILLPGLLCDERLWHHQVAAFQDDYDIIIPDFSDFDSIEAMAKSVVDNVSGSFYLAGLSMGGYVALEILSQWPERIKKLVLLNTSARQDDIKMHRRRRALIAQVKGIGTFRGITNKLLKLLIAPQHLEDDQLVTLIKKMTQDIGKEIYLKHQHAILYRTEKLTVLEHTKVPILCIGGADDQIISVDETLEMAKKVNSDAVVLQDCGHLSALEKPDKINQSFKGFF